MKSTVCVTQFQGPACECPDFFITNTKNQARLLCIHLIMDFLIQDGDIDIFEVPFVKKFLYMCKNIKQHAYTEFDEYFDKFKTFGYLIMISEKTEVLSEIKVMKKSIKTDVEIINSYINGK